VKVIQLVHRLTASFGKVRLAIRDGHYFVESNDAVAMDTLLADSMLRGIFVATREPKATVAMAPPSHEMETLSGQELFNAVIRLDEDDEDEESDYSFEVSAEAIEVRW